MKEFLKFIAPDKNFWRMLFIMVPACFLGWLFFPVGTITYIDWVIVFMLIQIWDDVMDLKK